MTDKKFTDEEIIKRLTELSLYTGFQEKYIQVLKDSLDLINRQKSEIERLKECPKCIYEYDGEVTEYCVQGPCPNCKTVEQIKTEAYKECLAKVKNYIKTHCNPYGKPDFDYDTSIKILNFIDKLSKEMVGE